MITRINAWLRRTAARIECAFTGEHVKPANGWSARGYRTDHWTCARCGDPVTVYRGPQ